ncbi:hypothetical protein [Thiopseudomonas denitrificans]|uniref:hypothetical protein n=1 Tax=Thiopseudomonas denitrificans TaxID=1501432 RepID=UPI0011AF639E|nr:hypothetical protein [Thiopseudomonas denitrificans]
MGFYWGACPDKGFPGRFQLSLWLFFVQPEKYFPVLPKPFGLMLRLFQAPVSGWFFRVIYRCLRLPGKGLQCPVKPKINL